MGTYNIQEFTSNECLNQLLFVNDLYVTSGKIKGHSVIHKFGHNLDIDSSFETIWSFGGNYSFLESPTILKISSSDTNDSSLDTGARTITIQGLNSEYNEVEELITLNGQTAVNTQNTYLRIHRMFVKTAGSSSYNEGIL